ncbi:acyl carrier protein [Stappia sp. ES.058]|uniref:acyl carrier protein n=1 Tax=Stappia sp. ES.058 TaxID=1881061 RepID=UPI00087B55E3|nr:acyl carrier protein [Stappia sp. ES.058]SDU03429.1 Phosphopantetheine attachment site [Stappia sp. ES.058]
MDAQTLETDDVHKTIYDYLIENSGVNVSGGIDPEENLLDSGILDSLGIAEITEFVEKTFEIEIDEDEITSQNYRTVTAFTAFCREKIAASAT